MQDNVAADMDLRQVISLLLKGTLQLFNTRSGERARAAAQANSIPTSASFATLGKAIRNSRYRIDRSSTPTDRTDLRTYTPHTCNQPCYALCPSTTAVMSSACNRS